eukprot:EG_transcript_18699
MRCCRAVWPALRPSVPWPGPRRPYTAAPPYARHSPDAYCLALRPTPLRAVLETFLNPRQTKDALRSGLVRVKDQTVKRLNFVVPAGAAVYFQGYHPQPDESQPLEVIAETDRYIIVNKPAGVPCHLVSAAETGTVLNAVVARYPHVVGLGDQPLQCGLAHRLDVDASGALLIAQDAAALAAAREALGSGTATKAYVAVVHGRWCGEERQAKVLKTVQHAPARVAVVPEGEAGGKLCEQVVREVKYDATSNVSAVQVLLKTGHQHQIRVLMADAGHPVVGDPVYGLDGPLDQQAGRLLLHSHTLRLATAAGAVGGTAPLPPPFEALVGPLTVPDPVPTPAPRRAP